MDKSYFSPYVLDSPVLLMLLDFLYYSLEDVQDFSYTQMTPALEKQSKHKWLSWIAAGTY